MAAPATPIPVDGTQDKVLRAAALGSGAVYGLAIVCTSAAVFNLRCVSASGQIVMPFKMATDSSLYLSWPGGIVFDRGVFEDWVSGAYTGTVFIGDG